MNLNFINVWFALRYLRGCENDVKYVTDLINNLIYTFKLNQGCYKIFQTKKFIFVSQETICELLKNYFY